MSKHHEKNQADHLMKLFQEVANHQPDEALERDEAEEKEEALPRSYVELDILDLPPRREVHGERKTRMSFTLSNPFIRLLVVILILVLVIVLMYYFNIFERSIAGLSRDNSFFAIESIFGPWPSIPYHRI